MFQIKLNAKKFVLHNWPIRREQKCVTIERQGKQTTVLKSADVWKKLKNKYFTWDISFGGWFFVKDKKCPNNCFFKAWQAKACIMTQN